MRVQVREDIIYKYGFFSGVLETVNFELNERSASATGGVIIGACILEEP